MKRGVFRSILSGAMTLVAVSALGLADEPAAKEGLASKLRPFVDAHKLAGAVTLVADRDGVLDLDAVGIADVAAQKPLRGDPGCFALSRNGLWNMQDGRWDQIPEDSAICHPGHLP